MELSNKKGFTMVEMMISIALISIVMVFLVKLLVDVRYDGTNELYDTKDQISRAEIIKTIENDLKDRIIVDIKKNDNQITITSIASKDSSEAQNSYIVVEKHKLQKLKYSSDVSGVDKLWSLKTTNKETHYAIDETNLNVISSNSSNDCYISLNIPLYVDDTKTNTRENNVVNNKILLSDSTLDNIRLSFYQKNKCDFNSF